MLCTIAGPLLSALFQRAFVGGLHDPHQRPSASDWENAIVRTVDLIQLCSNKCDMGWYVFDNTTRAKCPYCDTGYVGKLPVLNFYSSRHSGCYHPDNRRLMVWDGQSLFPWHINRAIFPNEHLTPDQRRRVGYFQLHQGDWCLLNENMTQMFDMTAQKDVAIGANVCLTEGGQILLSREERGRLAQIQMANV